MEKKFYSLVSDFFHTQIDSLKPSTQISHLSGNPHDLILFTFEIEKNFNIEFDDNEIEKLDKISSYIRVIKRKLKIKSGQFKKAA